MKTQFNMDKFKKLYDHLDEVALTLEQRRVLFSLLAQIELDYEHLSVSRRPDSVTWMNDLKSN